MFKRIIAFFLIFVLAIPFCACEKNEEDETKDIWDYLKDAKTDTLKVVEQYQNGDIDAEEASKKMNKNKEELFVLAVSVAEEEWPLIGNYVYMYVDVISGEFNHLVENCEEGSECYELDVKFIKNRAADLEKLELDNYK